MGRDGMGRNGTERNSCMAEMGILLIMRDVLLCVRALFLVGVR